MRGLFTPILIWTLVALPLLAAVCRLPRRGFMVLVSVLGVGALSLWLAVAAMGYRVTENVSTSLNGHIYVHKKGEPFKKGDLVAFRWHGGATYPRGTIFIKRVVGVPGDAVTRVENKIWVGDQYIGIAKPKTRAGVPLEPAAGGVIPPGEYFVATPSPDSLDSRYSLSGNIKQAAIIGRAHEIF